MKQNVCGKRLIRRHKTRWEDLDKKDVESLGESTNWKEIVMNRKRWRIGCEM